MRRGGFQRRHVSRFEHYLQARHERTADGFEPVRCCCDCRLLGWLKHEGAHRIESALIKSTGEVVLTYARIVFGVIETGEVDEDLRTEYAWRSTEYTLGQLGKFPDFERATENDLLLDPAPSWTLAGYLPTDRGMP